MIIVRLQGGLGNQMFQYAIGRALSLKNNTTLGLDTHDLMDRTAHPGQVTFRNYDLDLLSVTAQVLTQDQIPARYRSLGTGITSRITRKIRDVFVPHAGVEQQFHFDGDVLDSGPESYLTGYWQSPRYFEGYEDTIRADFKVAKPLPEIVVTLQKQIKEQQSVCIHVRRGDYVGSKVHDVVTKEYYDQALKMLQSKVAIDCIYVFSDDIKWCEENLTFSYLTIFVGAEYAGERAIVGHFELMRACTHFIIPNSSFAWWAAWLSESPDKIVIAPKQWFVDASIDSTDVTPKEWIRI